MRFEQVVSLGWNCQTAFQMRRHFGRSLCPSGIFDNQTTPHDAVIEYLNRDFHGVFERKDLAMGEIKVEHIHLRTGHMHSFPIGIDADYQTARSRHLYLCSKTRRVIHGRTPTLFVVGTRADACDAPARISRTIMRLNPWLPFHILAIATEHQPEPTRPYPDDWQGNDDFWSDAFSAMEVEAKPLSNRTPLAFAKDQALRFMGHVRGRRF